jgi:hypothetical protein
MSIIRDLTETEVKILTAAGESRSGITLADTEALMAPQPSIQTLTWLFQHGYLEHPTNDAGTEQARLHVLTVKGERLLKRYEKGEKKPARDPKQHEEIPAAELKRSGMTVVEPEKPAAKKRKTPGKVKRTATANA